MCSSLQMTDCRCPGGAGLLCLAPLVTREWHWSDGLASPEQPPGATTQTAAHLPPWELVVSQSLASLTQCSRHLKKLAKDNRTS